MTASEVERLYDICTGLRTMASFIHDRGDYAEEQMIRKWIEEIDGIVKSNYISSGMIRFGADWSGQKDYTVYKPSGMEREDS